jgi:hypothetical protein
MARKDRLGARRSSLHFPRCPAPGIGVFVRRMVKLVLDEAESARTQECGQPTSCMRRIRAALPRAFRISRTSPARARHSEADPSAR